jgi:hypothetical protein
MVHTRSRIAIDEFIADRRHDNGGLADRKHRKRALNTHGRKPEALA